MALRSPAKWRSRVVRGSGPCGASPEPERVITEGPSGGGSSEAAAINDAGRVVGWASDQGGALHRSCSTCRRDRPASRRHGGQPGHRGQRGRTGHRTLQVQLAH
jgi:hypothetical protein